MAYRKKSTSSLTMEPAAISELISIATQPITFAKHILGFDESLLDSSMSTPKDICPFANSMDYREPAETSDGEEEEEEQVKKDAVTKLPIYTLREVGLHDTFDDCWIVLYDKVYDITSFFLAHPGGEDVMLEYAGRDATLAFRGVGHSSAAIDMLEEYLVGILPMEERIFSLCGWEVL